MTVRTRPEESRTLGSDSPSSSERLVKSNERVRDLGEVFTPNATVQEMLDLLPSEIWDVHPSPTFLEPACGDGNFLVAILARKLGKVSEQHLQGDLPGGTTVAAVQFHALEALASIYAVDISVENIVGGTVGHEVGARTRLLTTFKEWHNETLGKSLSNRSPIYRACEWVVKHNLIVGNMLPFDALGQPTGRELLPLIEYNFEPEKRFLVLRKTTMGDVMDAASADTSDMLSLFSPIEPVEFWSGKASDLSKAEHVETPQLSGPVRNGAGSRK